MKSEPFRHIVVFAIVVLAACTGQVGSATQSAPAGTATAPLTAAPTPSMSVAAWVPYSSSTFRVSLRYPPYWQLDASGDAVYSSPDGFFQITAVESLGPSAKAICQREVENAQTHPDKPGLLQFGRQPVLQIL